jgi:hypothetical protein
LQKILTSLRVGPNATQARPTEKSNHTTIFSRGADSGRKLLSSLKNFFSRTNKSPASATVAQAIPKSTTESIKVEKKKTISFEPPASTAVAKANSQTTTESVKMENTKSMSVDFEQRTRLRMAYRNLLDPSQKGLGSREKGQGYEEKVSHFDSALFKVGKKLPLNQGDQDLLKDVLPKLQTAVEINEQLKEPEKIQLLSDIQEIKNKR